MALSALSRQVCAASTILSNIVRGKLGTSALTVAVVNQRNLHHMQPRKLLSSPFAQVSHYKVSRPLLQTIFESKLTSKRSITLEYMHKTGVYKKPRKKKNSPLEGRPQLRGVVLKTLIKKPKKPNSANRKCVRLRLSTGREVTAYVPGEGHNLQEHNIVLVRGGRLQDTPGVKLECVRGKYDLPHVKKK